MIHAPLFTVAAFVLLAAAAWTGVIAAHLVTVSFRSAAGPRRNRIITVA
jgi:hypothetical protein